MTLQMLLTQGCLRLEQAGIYGAKEDAWILMSWMTHMNRSTFYLHDNEEASEEWTERYLQLIARRALHEPVQYITGTAPFMGMDFAVSPAVLIPRFDTEVLVSEVLREISETDDVLDMCTGSGCIGISLAKLAHCKVWAVDISKEALAIAKKNATDLQAEITFVISNMFENVTGEYDFIVSNPPYIRPDVIQTLEPEVRDHEPMLALDGHQDGLYFYRVLARDALSHLHAGGGIALEIGYDQGEAVTGILSSDGYERIQVKKDLAGLDRVVLAHKPL